jgi:prepilin-type N-terminal cleavage/methylation domain-containing protein
VKIEIVDFKFLINRVVRHPASGFPVNPLPLEGGGSGWGCLLKHSNTLPFIPSLQGRGNRRALADLQRVCSFKRPSGFTLLELAVVLFIISLFAAIILPSFAGLGENELKSEAEEMASILRYLSDSALSRKETYYLKIDLDKNMVSWSGPDGEKAKRFGDLTGVKTQSAGLLSGGELTFFFEPVGVRENLSIRLGKADKNFTITLNHLSGRVKIIDKDEG